MEINEYLVKLFQTIKDMEELNLFADTAKLSKTEFRLIREVLLEREKGRGIISSELARRLGITRSAVSQIVTKLEKQGTVQRVASPTDRKIAYICLSDRAMAIFEGQCAHANEIIGGVVEELGEEKMKALIAAYDEFLEVFARVRRRRLEEGATDRKEES